VLRGLGGKLADGHGIAGEACERVAVVRVSPVGLAGFEDSGEQVRGVESDGRVPKPATMRTDPRSTKLGEAAFRPVQRRFRVTWGAKPWFQIVVGGLLAPADRALLPAGRR
jgi:hypothetical protein